MWASAGVSLSACCMPSWCNIINEFWCEQKWPSIPNKQKGLGLWHLRALTLRLHGSPYCTSHKTNIKKKYQKYQKRVSHANNVLPFVCVAGSKAVLTDCNRRKLRFCFLDQSRDIRFCLNYLGSISSQMDSTTWKAWCISRLSKQLVGEAKLTKTYAQRCYYRLDPSFTITAKSKTLARLSLRITIFTWNAMVWKLSIAAWHPAVQKISCVHPRIVGPNQAPKPNICFGLLG